MRPQTEDLTDTPVTPEFGRYREGLAALSRFTSRDTVVIATEPSTLSRHGLEANSNLSLADVDGLAIVIRDLERNHLNLILHGEGGHLDAAAEVVSLLRGRFETIRAMVPERAISAMALLACACDVVMMPGSGLIGATDDLKRRPVTSDAARDWLSRNCEHPDRRDRVAGISEVFKSNDNPRAPLPATAARRHGLPISVFPERSAIGQSLEYIQRNVYQMMLGGSLVKLIDCQKGPVYRVSSAECRPMTHT
jgi:hypothetical protein